MNCRVIYKISTRKKQWVGEGKGYGYRDRLE